MEQSDRFVASLTEAGRYQLLVQAVTDYAIYMLATDRRRRRAVLEIQARNVSKVTLLLKSWSALLPFLH